MSRYVPVAAATAALAAVTAACPALDRVAIANTPPTVAVEGPAAAPAGQQVTLKAVVSDADAGDAAAAAVEWAQAGGAAVVLSSTTDREVTFQAPPARGTLVFAVSADDGLDEGPRALFGIEISFNNAPAIDTAPALSTPNGTSLQLSADVSDVDGDTVTLGWSVAAAPPGACAATPCLAGETTAAPLFSPDSTGAFTLQLTATDDGDPPASTTATVQVTVANGPPRARLAEAIAQAPNTQPFALVGDAVDPEGDAVASWQWSVAEAPAGATFELLNAGAQEATFIPRGRGSYRITLVASDVEGGAGPPADLLFVALNNAPVVVVPFDRALPNLQSEPLSATFSDADGDDVSFAWQVTSAPAGAAPLMEGAATSEPLFTPRGVGAYVVQCVATDETGAPSAPAALTITALNNAPVADAGGDVADVATGAIVTLDGAGSVDADGDALSFAWSIVAGSGSFDGGVDDVDQPAFVADNALGPVSLRLVVTDERGAVSAADDVVIDVSRAAPIAVPATVDGAPFADAGLQVALDGTGSIAFGGGTVDAYLWSVVDGAGVTLENASTALAAANIPAALVGETVRFALVVFDDGIASAPAELALEVIPSDATNVFADAGADCGGPCDGTRAKPYTSLQDAFDDADAANKPILVAAGSYTRVDAEYRVPAGRTIIGGCETTRWSCDAPLVVSELRVTQLGPDHTLRLLGGGIAPATTRLSRLRAVGVTGDGTGTGFFSAIFCEQCSAELTDVEAIADGSAGFGGTDVGVLVQGSPGPVSLTRVVAIGGRSERSNGVRLEASSDVTIVDSSITTPPNGLPAFFGPPTSHDAFVVVAPASGIRVERTLIEVFGEASVDACAAAVLVGDAHVSFVNDIFSVQSACNGNAAVPRLNVGLFLSNTLDVEVVQSTFVGNDSAAILFDGRDEYAAIYVDGASAQVAGEVVNSVVHNFSRVLRSDAGPGIRLSHVSMSAFDVALSSLVGAGSVPSYVVFDNGHLVAPAGAANSPDDCGIADPEGGDFHIAAGSFCVDSGDAGDPRVPDVDLDGDARSDGAPDRGADEVVP